jgi:GH43 family beta-xylosidase
MAAAISTLLRPLDTQGWAIDGTILTDRSGNRIFVWSGWPGARNGRQNLYAARMASPTQLVGPRVLLAEPDRIWERRGMPICEGPQILQRDGRVFIVYSASGSWTQDYCLGLLSFNGGDLLDPRSWRKTSQVFAKNKHAVGVGHCCFVDGGGGADWLVYHAKTSRRNGWSDREVRAQTFGWHADGTPDFGAPLAVESSRAPALRELVA